MVRAGIGYDLHRLDPGRRLVLGSLTIEHEAGLFGHSDGDVVLHAVTDALLGAAGLPDIGEQFPDTDPAYAGADSTLLLRTALGKVRDRGFRPVNLDLVIHAERPKLSAYKQPMREAIAKLLERSVEDINVKAKTNEGVGPVGRGEAIACTAVVLIASSEPESSSPDET